MKFRIGAMLLVMLGMSQFAFAANERQFQWPGKIRAAVSLSYDDALNSHLDQVIPALDKYRLKGSFYLTLSNPSVATRMSEWRAAAQRGHELGNHTLFHQCSAALPGREWVQPKNDLDRTSADQLKDQILLANTMLHAIDGKRERTFTVPCGDQQAGGVNYVEMLKSDFVAIKARAGSGVTADMMALDPYSVEVVAPSNVSGRQLIEMVEAAAAKGTMVNFTFHGVNGDYLQISKEAHDELLKFLAARRNVYWTDTFINIMKYVKAKKEGL